MLIAHYGRQGLPRVPIALGEGPVALGEDFPECNSRGRGFGEEAHGEAAFPECQKLYTRGRLHREAKKHSGKNYGFFLKKSQKALWPLQLAGRPPLFRPTPPP
jgi:hypothetical protein